MPLVNAKCTNCGANLKVDNTKDATICEHCGSAFIVEKAINNYNITNNNTIHADIVNIFATNSTSTAHKSLDELINKDIKEIAKAGYNRLLAPEDLIQILSHVSIKPNALHAKILNKKIEEYCINLDFQFDFDYANNNFCDYNWLNQLWKDAGNDGTDGYNFQSWIEYPTNRLTGKYEVLKSVQKKVTDYYIDLIKQGKTSAKFCDGMLIELWGVKSNNRNEFINIENKLNNQFLLPFFSDGLRNANDVNKELSKYSRCHYLFCLGKYYIYTDYEYGYSEYKDGQYFVRLNEIINRKKNNLCPYCGHKYKGVFTKVCSHPLCGKPKDY